MGVNDNIIDWLNSIDDDNEKNNKLWDDFVAIRNTIPKKNQEDEKDNGSEFESFPYWILH